MGRMSILQNRYQFCVSIGYSAGLSNMESCVQIPPKRFIFTNSSLNLSICAFSLQVSRVHKHKWNILTLVKLLKVLL